MEIRKVQVTGGSSYIITLPKEWIRSQNIKKNHPLGLIAQNDGTLVVTPNTSGEQTYRKKEIQVDDIDDAKYLFRLLIGAYIMGYSVIEIKAKKRIAPAIRDCVIKFTQSAIGPEIIEEGITTITTKNLLDPTEMPFEKTIKRMYILVRTMHEDAIEGLSNLDLSLEEDVITRDKDVDRLHWLISRQSNLVLRNGTLSKKMKVSQEGATYYFLMGRILERIGDHAVRIANNVPILLDKKVGTAITDTIVKASTLSMEIFNDSINAWADKDIGAANKNIESITKLVSYAEKVNKSAQPHKGKVSIAISYIGESIRRTGEYSGDISELLINRLINE